MKLSLRHFLTTALIASALSSALLGGCASSTDGSSASYKCPTSSSKSGTLCQVNFNCTAPAASPAAYCSDDGSCACGAAADNPKKFTSAGICGKPLAEMAKIANEQCAFGQ